MANATMEPDEQRRADSESKKPKTDGAAPKLTAAKDELDDLFGCSFRDSGGGVQKHQESDMLLSRLARSDGPDLQSLLGFGGGMRDIEATPRES